MENLHTEIFNPHDKLNSEENIEDGEEGEDGEDLKEGEDGDDLEEREDVSLVQVFNIP